MSEGAVRMGALAVAGLALAAPPSVMAEVVFDGTLGPAGMLNGVMEIPDSFGQQVGTNLFHSFETFNVNVSESATFTSAYAGATTNVIGRVTGGALSTIDGQLASAIPGADLWLVNPSGLVFGENATLDVQAGFHASTADHLLLEDGGRFDASVPGNTVLTMANPAAFGFVGPANATLSISGATLGVPDGQPVSLVAGGLNLADALVAAPGGDVSLMAHESAGAYARFDPAAEGHAGSIQLHASSVVTSGASGGNILVVAGELWMHNDSYLTANSTGSAPGDSAGDITVIAGDIGLRSGSQLSSTTFGAGHGGVIRLDATNTVSFQNAGPGGGPAGVFANVRATASGDGGVVDIAAREVSILEGGLVGALTFGAGDAGAITITGDERVLVRNTGDGNFGAIFANSIDLGDGAATGGTGSVTISAPLVELLENARIQASSRIGQAGSIAIVADDLTATDGSQVVTSGFGTADAGSITLNVSGTIRFAGTDESGFPSGAFTLVNFPASGSGGDIVVETDVLELLDGAQLTGSAGFFGNGGDILVSASDRVTVSGGAFPLFTGIFSNTYSFGQAGRIVVDTPQLDVGMGGFLQSNAFTTEFGPAQGNAGDILIDVDRLEINGGFVQSRTEAIGAGGNIAISAAEAVRISNPPGFIHSSAFPLERAGLFVNTLSNAPAGTIVVNTGEFQIRDGGFVDAGTVGASGAGGSIAINADSIDVSATTNINSAIVSSASGSGPAGDIELVAADIRIHGLGSVQAVTTADGAGGAIMVTADRLSIADGGSILGLTLGGGRAGDIAIEANEVITIAGSVDALPGDFTGPLGASTVNSQTDGSGHGGNVAIRSDLIVLDAGGEVSVASSADGDGGDVAISARLVQLDGGGRIAAAATGAGRAGNIALLADDAIAMSGGSVETSAASSAGGSVDIRAVNMLRLVGSSVTASAGGVSAGDDGGNVFIDPRFVILENSQILASANAGNGGNIAIQAGSFLIDTTSAIDASSQAGLDGEIAIDSPNQITGGVIPIEVPTSGVAALLAERCVPQLAAERSTLTADVTTTNGVLPGDYLPSRPLLPVATTEAADARNATATDAALVAAHRSAC